ncbi:MAG: ferrochelatase [Methylococcus sp.]
MTDTSPKTCLLLVNLGTPEAPTPQAVRRYLAEFLIDPRVVQIPKPIWWLILHGIILRTRPRKSAHAYQSIWTERGSPLMVFTEDLAETARAELALRGDNNIVVGIAMRYGRPSIPAQLEKHKAAGVTRFIVLPLYPQYAAATTASIFDKVAETVLGWKHIPSANFISDYHLNVGYVNAIAASIERYWKANGKSQKLLFSLHGLPAVSRKQGDPYHDQCVASTRAIAARLGLADGEWMLVFQSRFGAQEWLKPYCVEALKELPGQGIKTVDVVCPGFAVDCLETLEEIAIANKEIFIEAGGTQYRYIPALNASAEHARVLLDLVL